VHVFLTYAFATIIFLELLIKSMNSLLTPIMGEKIIQSLPIMGDLGGFTLQTKSKFIFQYG